MINIFKSGIRGKCGSCRTGKELYELDKPEPMCPYIGSYSHKKRKCPYYVRLDKPKKIPLKQFMKGIIKKGAPPEN